MSDLKVRLNIWKNYCCKTMVHANQDCRAYVNAEKCVKEISVLQQIGQNKMFM